jgi:predicted nucleic acid-binding protein
MRQLVVDTDVVSYIFKRHPSAPRYVQALRGNDPVISFMTLAEVRFGALQAVWGYRKKDLLERYLADFAVCYPDERIGQRLGGQLPQRCQYRSAIGSTHQYGVP